MPKISVIMPVYNSAATLPRAIESILAQTYTDFEFIIINDFGSDDGSAEIIKEYQAKDNRMRLIQLDSRAGIAESLNIGIRSAVGEYIARMDADDYSYPERFAKQLDFLANNPEYVLCGTAFRVVTRSGARKFSPWYGDDDEIKAHLLFNCTFCHPTIMLKRRIFTENGLSYATKMIAEDYELWTRIDGKMANLPDVLLDYYGMEDGSTVNNLQEARIAACRIMKNQFKRRLQISIDAYRNCIINPDLYSKSNFCFDDMEQAFRLLKEIEYANRKYHYYAPYALAAALCRQWNRYVETFFCRASRTGIGLPILEYHGEDSFLHIMQHALEMQESVLELEIKKRIRFTLRILASIHKVAVFGVGQRAKNYFSANIDYLKYVTFFSDNNASVINKDFFGKEVIAPAIIKLRHESYDMILISSEKYYDEIASSIKKQLGTNDTPIASLSVLKMIDYLAQENQGRDE